VLKENREETFTGTCNPKPVLDFRGDVEEARSARRDGQAMNLLAQHAMAPESA
jgi:hypothetical protein